MDILRFTTAGSVDDGKSTLIGRLLYDTNSIKADVLETLLPGNDMNLAYVTDGLRAERAQGITIDVAYKYFSTDQRKFIITDAPGHFEYTRNLVTGASNVDLVIILIDARNGITDQTRRHSLVASFLHIGKVIVAINKMDMMNYDEQVFNTIKAGYEDMASKLGLDDVTYIPVSALLGDNVLSPSQHMSWYTGDTLMHMLESYKVPAYPYAHSRFSVQCAVAPGIYAGKLLSGTLKAGDEIIVNPSGERNTIKEIIHNYQNLSEIHAPADICISLITDVNLQRGHIISHAHNLPLNTNSIQAKLCWMDSAAALDKSKEYILRLNTAETTCHISELLYKTDLDTLQQYNDEVPLSANQFAGVRIETKDKLACDAFSTLTSNARGILIDPANNNTVAAFTING